jgi:hypothetical protein
LIHISTPAMAQAAEKQQDSQSRKLDPLNGIFPLDGITFEEGSNIDKGIAIPACGFDDSLWFGDSSDLLRKLQSSIGTEMRICDGTSYCLPVVQGGKFFPVNVPFVTTSHRDIELERRCSREGLSPNLDNTITSSSSITWPWRPIWPNHPIFGKEMGLSPLWVQTPKGTRNRKDIHKLLSSFTYYVLVFVEDTDGRVDLKRQGLTWSPHVWNPDGRLIDRFREWCPYHNIEYEPRPSPSAMWDDVNQKWICPEPLTQLPELPDDHDRSVLVTVRPCGLRWLRDPKTRKSVSYVKYVSCGTGHIYLGADRNMKCSNWAEYRQLHKGKTIQLRIQCSSVKRFSLNSFKEGYEWDQDRKMWALSSPDRDCDDSDSYDSDNFSQGDPHEFDDLIWPEDSLLWHSRI